jgi:hypothetical protein
MKRTYELIDFETGNTVYSSEDQAYMLALLRAEEFDPESLCLVEFNEEGIAIQSWLYEDVT